ncbi:uncharacterized protein PAN0_065c6552 [Moesziomyces antarcticus]|uniref:Uncharacterized protein n=2 Tax=Pseudozyma antarctica TaxID=84753 RepID=A0A081CNR1_PSEA2|nr:uncharacterized protein PAN0_065c6552 [Moesziomyces antarcticus]GAK68307.1 hypothetical protein PAN0_065c6552 [Moesziomyces antarcticus]SPO49293.1 uncharacterized protein PSANT_06984 [Moesziomyces antarcticus]
MDGAGRRAWPASIAALLTVLGAAAMTASANDNGFTEWRTPKAALSRRPARRRSSSKRITHRNRTAASSRLDDVGRLPLTFGLAPIAGPRHAVPRRCQSAPTPSRFDLPTSAVGAALHRRVLLGQHLFLRLASRSGTLSALPPPRRAAPRFAHITRPSSTVTFSQALAPRSAVATAFYHSSPPSTATSIYDILLVICADYSDSSLQRLDRAGATAIHLTLSGSPTQAKSA